MTESSITVADHPVGVKDVGHSVSYEIQRANLIGNRRTCLSLGWGTFEEGGTEEHYCESSHVKVEFHVDIRIPNDKKGPTKIAVGFQ